MAEKMPEPKAIVTWRRPSLFRREYELLLDGQVVAVLRQRGILNVTTDIYEPDGLDEEMPVLTLTRSGVFRQHIHVKSGDGRFPHIKKAPLSLGGETTIILADGRAYTWEHTNFWQTKWQLVDENGDIVCIAQRDNWGYGGEFWVYAADLTPSDVRFLLYVSWYVTVLKMEDAAAAAAAAAA